MKSPLTGEHEKLSSAEVPNTRVIEVRRKSPGRRNVVLVLLVVGIALAIAAFFALQRKPPERKMRDRAVPVVVATAKIDSVPIEIRTIGNVLPYSVVNVTPQVGGQLQKVFFSQGAFVHKGDPLFQIDPRPYQATLEQTKGTVEKDQAQVDVAQSNLARDAASIGQYQANLKKDQAQLEYAKREMARYNSLFQQGAVSQEQGEQMNTNALAAQATIQADLKTIENARAVMKADSGQIESAKGVLSADRAAESTAALNLSWTKIVAPMDGRTSSLQVYEGNVVTAGTQTPLVSIAQVKPIYIQFTLPEQNLDQIRRALSAGTLKVEALVEGERANSVMGTVSFLENTVNTTSGTIALRATFANENLRLFPGQFVDVLVSMPPPNSSVVVPSSAVQISQTGNSVYILRPGNTVDFVPVTVDRSWGDLSAISAGLKPGDQVVVDGQMQLTPKAKVRVVPPGGAGPGGRGRGNSPDGSPGGPGASQPDQQENQDQTGGQSGDQSSGQYGGMRGHHHHRGGAPDDSSGSTPGTPAPPGLGASGASGAGGAGPSASGGNHQTPSTTPGAAAGPWGGSGNPNSSQPVTPPPGAVNLGAPGAGNNAQPGFHGWAGGASGQSGQPGQGAGGRHGHHRGFGMGQQPAAQQ